MTRVTKTMVAVFDTLATKKGWAAAGEISAALDVPPQNLNYALKRLMEERAVVREDSTRPIHYKIAPDAPREVLGRIEMARSIFGG